MSDDVTKIMNKLRDMIVENHPGKSVCVDCQTWHHNYSPGHSTDVRYGVGILPGLDGSKCQRFYFATIAELGKWITAHTETSVTV